MWQDCQRSDWEFEKSQEGQEARHQISIFRWTFGRLSGFLNNTREESIEGGGEESKKFSGLLWNAAWSGWLVHKPSDSEPNAPGLRCP